MERTVSVILPTGEVEIIQRENVDDTTWNKPIFPKLAVSLDSARCSLEAMRKKLGRRGPKNSKNQMTSELEVKSANDIHNKPSIRKTILKNSSASSAKIPLHDSTQLEVLHHKSSNPYDVSTVFMIQQ
ncbi:uncharacterized protein LOC130444541 [Diorhabda sublineata]|uniref:uncharacterized protein LOC130444541 n=1 Tax=Diorhabda sublineata TaxID=1163346 RepID=UPI0024E07A6E|nr:uncharacterized protein LOC130444541 [Diorhabda sublineata]